MVSVEGLRISGMGSRPGVGTGKPNLGPLAWPFRLRQV